MAHKNSSSSTRGALHSVLESVSVNFVGTFITRTIGFGSTLLLTSALTDSAFGVYVFVTTFVGVLGTLTQFGARQSLMKFLPMVDCDKQNAGFQLATGSVVVGNAVCGVLLFIGAPTIELYVGGGALFVGVLRVFTVVMFFESIRKVLTSGFFAIELPKYGIAIERIIYPIIRITCIAVAIFLGFNLTGISNGILVAAISGLVIATALLGYKTDLRPTSTDIRDVASDYYRYAGTIMLRQIGMTLYTRADVILLGLLASNASVGVYKIAWMLAVIVDLPLNGVGKVFPSIVSRFYDEGRDEDLENVFTVVTKWTFTLSLILFVGAVVYRLELLGLFGATYAEEGVIVLLLVAFSQLFGNFVGPHGMVLLMTGYQKVNTVQIWLFGIVTVALNIMLIPMYGLYGAAIAMFTGYVVLDIIRVFEVWYFHGYFPFSAQLWRPLVCGLIAASVMEGFRYIFNGLPVLIVGGGAGVLTYAVLIWLLVFDEEDQELVSTIKS